MGQIRVPRTYYEDYADRTKRVLDVFTKEHMTKVFNADPGRINTLVATLRAHHRQARSINLHHPKGGCRDTLL